MTGAALPEGAIIECLVADQERGLQARKVLSIDLSQAIIPEAPRARPGAVDRGRSVGLDRRGRRI
jgi:CspA family cold shock protein